jgi:hypothetical protein
MALKLKLMYNDPTNFDGLEIVEEQTNRGSGSNLYVQGVYLGSEINKNGRIYPEHELDREINRYLNEMVVTKRSLGELNHSNTSEVNPERACHLVTELRKDGKAWVGKSKILSGEGMICGNIVRGLINNGVSLGMSTRSLGSLREASGHKVVENMNLVAIDCVADPSYPTAFVDGILESKSWTITENGDYEQIYEDFGKALKTLPKHDVDNYLRAQIIKFIQQI